MRPDRHAADGLDRDEVAARVSIGAVAAALGIEMDAKKSAPAKGDLWALCPFHAERTPSCRFNDRKGLFKCFGCGAAGGVFDLVMQHEGCGFRDALARVAEIGGVVPEAGVRLPEADWRAAAADGAAAHRAGVARDAAPGGRVRRAWLSGWMAAERAAAEAEAAASAERRLDYARAIWEAAAPGAPALARYLAGRGVDLAALAGLYAGGLPPSLRLAAGLACREGGLVVHRGPAMVGRIAWPGRDGVSAFVGVHRTWIDGSARARRAGGADGGAKVPKQWLGMTGAIFGAPVAFSPPCRRMIVGEGIETVLAALARMAAAGDAWGQHPDGWGAHAALALGALAGPEAAVGRGPASRSTGRPLPSAIPDRTAEGGWWPPAGCEEVILLAEGSAKDPERAERDAIRAARRLARPPDGRVVAVRTVLPGGDWAAGMDYADLVVGN